MGVSLCEFESRPPHSMTEAEQPASVFLFIPLIYNQFKSRPENRGYIWPSPAQSKLREPRQRARAAYFVPLAGVFAGSLCRHCRLDRQSGRGRDARSGSGMTWSFRISSLCSDIPTFFQNVFPDFVALLRHPDFLSECLSGFRRFAPTSRLSFRMSFRISSLCSDIPLRLRRGGAKTNDRGAAKRA